MLELLIDGPIPGLTIVAPGGNYLKNAMSSGFSLESTGVSASHIRFFHIGALCAIILIGAALRGYHLGAECFDGDELCAVQIQGISPQIIAQVVARDGLHGTHPPLMTVPFLFWVALFGTDEAAVRSLPFLAGLLTIVLVYRLGVLLSNLTAGLFAAMFLAVNPLHIAYAQEARQYEVLTALVVSAHISFLRCLQRGWRIDQAIYVILCCLTLLTHYFGVIALSGHGLACGWLLLIGDRVSRHAGLKILMCLCLAMPSLAWLPVTRLQAPSPLTYLGKADVAGIVNCLTDAIGVRMIWGRGLLGLGLATAVIGVGCWGYRRNRLEAEDADFGSPFPRIWGLVAVLTGLLLVAFALSPLSNPLMATARRILVLYGHEGESLRLELRILRQLLLVSPLALAASGLFIVSWAKVTGWARGLIERLPPDGRSVDTGSLVVVLLLGPVLATWAIGLTGVGFLQTRSLIVLLPPICLGLGLGIETLGRTWPGRIVAVAAIIFLIVLASHYRPVSVLFGRVGYEVGYRTYDWKSLGNHLRRSETERLPLLSCRTPSTDPLLYYGKEFNPRRLSRQEGETAALPARFHFVHIERDLNSESLLHSIESRGITSKPLFSDDRLILLEVVSSADGRSSR